jgi:hypothetical protein
MTGRPLRASDASSRKQLQIDPLRRASLASRGAPCTTKLKVLAPVALRLCARRVFFVQALDQIRPALGRRPFHKGVEIGLKRIPETPRRIHGPPAHDCARSWDSSGDSSGQKTPTAPSGSALRDRPVNGVPAHPKRGLVGRRNFCATARRQPSRLGPPSEGAGSARRRIGAR